MEKPLNGKVAIVTGGGRGLGRAFAHALGAAGASVTVASRTPDDLNAFVDEATEAGFEAMACATDISSEDSVASMVAATVRRFGRVDILVNNSGIVATRPLVDQTLEEWDAVVNTNLRGVFLATREVGRHMIAQKSGKVINIASNFALKGIPNHVAYSSSKAGVIAFTRSVAVEWSRYNIQVNAIAPGYFTTDMNALVREDSELTGTILRMIPARRMGEPAELDAWILALAGDASNFMTGQTIVIDGGQAVT
ncbi:MAG: 3-oxoacyl-ACP reductase family protein [Mycetocola sp.]